MGKVSFDSPFIINVHLVQLSIVEGVLSFWVYLAFAFVMSGFGLLGIVIAKMG